MKITLTLLSCILVSPAIAQVTDVPPGHWARAAVQEMVSNGVMKAPGGKFDGAATISRRELANTLAAYAKSLMKGWGAGQIMPVSKSHRDVTLENTGHVTRYEVAAVLGRAARYAAQGVPKDRTNVFGKSEAFPPAPRVTLSPSDPAYAAVKYLASRRMIQANSVLLKSGTQKVSPAELTTAVALVLVGLNDQYTDEPQNREELSPPPNRHPR